MPPNSSRNADELLRQQGVLARFGALALRSENLDEILTEACRLVGEALGTDLAKVMTLQDDGITLLVRSGVGWKPGVVGAATVLRAETDSSEGRALRTGEPTTSDDIETETRFTYADFLKDNGVKALVNVIIIGPDGRPPYGILEVDSRRARKFTDDDIAFLQTYANLLAAAVDRLRVLEEMRSIVRDRERYSRELHEQDLRRRIAIEVGEVGLWELDLDTGALALDARMRRMTGVRGEELDAAGAFAAVHPDDRPRLDTELRRLAEGETETMSIQYRIIGIEDAVVRIVQVNARAIRDRNGKASRLVGAARDVTERVAADDRRNVLNFELAHRLKNTLALVSSIVTQTLRTAPDVASARKTLSDRIQALSKAHDVLMTGQRDAASIREVVHAASMLHDGGGKIHTTGPDLALGPRASLTLSLIVHELSTNAGKYGALSAEDGHVDVEWSVAPDAETRRPVLMFEWREVGGPPVFAPTSKSFGTRLIEMGLSGAIEGSSEIDYAPTGLRCRLTASLTELQSEDEAAG